MQPLPLFTDFSIGVFNAKVIDQVVTVGRSLRGMNMCDAVCPASAGGNSLHADRQDGFVRDTSLNRMQRSVAGGGVAQHQFRGEMPRKPLILFWRAQSCDTLIGLKQLIRFHSMKSSALEKNGAVQIA